MKKSGNFFWSFFILLIFGVAIFFIGWIQFFIPAGQKAILVSKTSGVYEKLLCANEFSWRWERLLPTNVQLRIFDCSPQNFQKRIFGEIPLGVNFFSKNSEKDAIFDFSYDFDFSIYISVREDFLIELVKEQNFLGTEDLRGFLDSQAEKIANFCAKIILEESKTNQFFSLDAETENFLLQKLNKNPAFKNLEISAITILNQKIPNFSLYDDAKKTCSGYFSSLEKELELMAKNQAQKILSDERSISKLEKIGGLLQKYPELAQIFQSGAYSEVLKIAGEEIE